MSSRRVMRTSAGRLLAAVVALGMVAGCSRTDDELAAQAVEVAEDVMPGTLELLDATRGIGGFEVTFAFVDDPTAAAVIRPQQGRLDAEQLEQGVTAARVQAAELRALRTVMQECGAPVVAVQFLGATATGGLEGGVWLDQDLVEDEVGTTVAHLEDCLQSWMVARSHVDELVDRELSSLDIRLVPTDLVARLPALDEDQPTILALMDRDRLALLEAEPHWRTFVTDPGVVPIQYSLLPYGDPDMREAVEANTVPAVAEWLAVQGRDWEATTVLWSHAHLEPDSLTRVRVPVRACPAGQSECTNSGLVGVVMVTIDLDTLAVGGHVAVADPFGPNGFSRPLEP